MITVKGIPISQRTTKKGKYFYLVVLSNGNFVKVLTSKSLELMKAVEVSSQVYIADKGQLILILD
jgi:hypothetical protein